MNSIFEMLKKRDLFKRGQLNTAKIQNLSVKEIIDVSESIEDNLQDDCKGQTNDLSFASSLDLSGVGGCRYYDCRQKRLDRLARFSLMYADKVYIGSVFSHFLSLKNQKKEELSQVQYDYLESLKLILSVKPLIEKGYLNVYPVPTRMCRNCLSKLLEQDAVVFEKAIDKLKSQFLLNVKAQAEMKRGKLACLFSSTKGILDCTRVRVFDDIPEKLQKRTNVLGEISSGQRVDLTPDLMVDLDLDSSYASDVVMNSSFGLLVSKLFKSSFLTGDQIHIDFLNSLNNSEYIKRNNEIADKHLTSIVPFIEDIALCDILKIREAEGDAFVIYRHALNEAMDHFKNAKEDFTEQNARNLYLDVIEPSLSKLNRTVTLSRKVFKKQLYRPVLGLVGTISFGVTTGLIKPELGAIATFAGLGSCLPDMINQILKLGDAEDAIQNEPFYFLWKVKQKAK
ncbi:MAG: hypothetical protein LLF76_14335 [Planctomycetaceae bacterium]|nr:hypothetical protein [Planctomycetaceae bacterium]